MSAVLCCAVQRKGCKDWVAFYSTSTWELQARTQVRPQAKQISQQEGAMQQLHCHS